MGTYTDFSVSGYPVLNSKSAVVAEAMTVFRESDKRVGPRRLGDRNALVWGDTNAAEADEIETATQYICDTKAAIARLDVMGFTINRVRREFNQGLQSELATNQEWAKDKPDNPWNAAKIALLDSLSFDSYLDALRQVILEGLRPEPVDDHKRPDLSAHVRYILDHNDDFLLGFFAEDVRCLIRAACEVAPKPGTVVQDITDLVEGGYYAVDESVCQRAIDSLILGHIENSNRIVLTEGSTDSQFLKASLDLLYPHLSDYYSFLDFESTRVAGGAGQLASLVKGFAAAGLGNRIIAIFDNDSAARDARRSLSQLRLPPNIVVLGYPELTFLRSYPTLGPGGSSDLDVNGLAASIELYFGEDILRRPDGSLAPVQWRGFVEAVGSYQGEVLGKGELQTAFIRKLSLAKNDSSIRAEQDWSGVDAILRSIFGAFRDEA
jgi:hypothetical protein